MYDSYTTHEHRPPHLFWAGATYFITAGTLHKRHYFDTAGKRDHVLDALITRVQRWGWRLEAWAVLTNHYHVVAQAPDDAKSLKLWLRQSHSLIARGINQLDGVAGRKVMYLYRDTCIANAESYYARLKYVHENPVKHGLAADAGQ